MFSAFCLANVLRATAACHFWTCELQKVVRTRQFFSIFTCKCAFRHSRVQFLYIATSKMAPPLWCFVHFDLQMCFSPQPRAIFEHRNVQNGSAHVVFCAFWLANVLRATAACNFWTSQLPKWLRPCGVFHILTYKYASRHSGVQFLNIVTSKMAPPPWCFPHFDLQICFAPQRRAIFHLSARTATSAPAALARLAQVLLHQAWRTWGLRNHWPWEAYPQSDDFSSGLQPLSGFVNSVRLAMAYPRFASIECFQGRWRVSDQRVRVLPSQQSNSRGGVASQRRNKWGRRPKNHHQGDSEGKSQLLVDDQHIIGVDQLSFVNDLCSPCTHPNCIQHMMSTKTMLFHCHKGSRTPSLKFPPIAAHVSATHVSASMRTS